LLQKHIFNIEKAIKSVGIGNKKHISIEEREEISLDLYVKNGKSSADAEELKFRAAVVFFPFSLWKIWFSVVFFFHFLCK